MGCGISKAETSHPLSKSELLDAESRSASDKRKGQGGEGVSRIKAEDADADAEKVLELKLGNANDLPTDTVSLASGHKVIRLHLVQSLERRKSLMAQVHDVIRQNYGSYADSESAVQWLDNMVKSGLNSADPVCKLLVTMVVDPDGGALGFSSAEVLPAGDRRYIYNAYTCVAHGTCARTGTEDEAVIQIVKQDIALCAKELRHVLGFTNYQLPVYSCEVTNAASGFVDPDLLAAKKKSGTRADLFVGDLVPHDPQMPFCEMLREFAACYVKAHSVYSPVMTDDPAYRAMVAFADSLPQEGDDAMFDKIYARAKLGAPEYCALSRGGLEEKDTGLRLGSVVGATTR